MASLMSEYGHLPLSTQQAVELANKMARPALPDLVSPVPSREALQDFQQGLASGYAQRRERLKSALQQLGQLGQDQIATGHPEQAHDVMRQYFPIMNEYYGTNLVGPTGFFRKESQPFGGIQRKGNSEAAWQSYLIAQQNAKEPPAGTTKEQWEGSLKALKEMQPGIGEWIKPQRTQKMYDTKSMSDYFATGYKPEDKTEVKDDRLIHTRNGRPMEVRNLSMTEKDKETLRSLDRYRTESLKGLTQYRNDTIDERSGYHGALLEQGDQRLQLDKDKADFGRTFGLLMEGEDLDGDGEPDNYGLPHVGLNGQGGVIPLPGGWKPRPTGSAASNKLPEVTVPQMEEWYFNQTGNRKPAAAKDMTANEAETIARNRLKAEHELDDDYEDQVSRETAHILSNTDNELQLGKQRDQRWAGDLQSYASQMGYDLIGGKFVLRGAGAKPKAVPSVQASPPTQQDPSTWHPPQVPRYGPGSPTQKPSAKPSAQPSAKPSAKPSPSPTPQAPSSLTPPAQRAVQTMRKVRQYWQRRGQGGNH